jgi:hypothetical protein
MEKYNIPEPNSLDSMEGVEKTKQLIWDEKRLQVDGIGDKLGLGIDEGIKDTVIAFNVLDINTSGSHEGKIDRYPIPYIDIECKNIDELNKKLEEAKTEEEQNLILKEIIRGNLIERKKIATLLEEFYIARKVPFEVQIGIQTLARGWSRIQSQGAELQEVETDPVAKRNKLDVFKKEMQAFTDFLKNKFFNS